MQPATTAVPPRTVARSWSSCQDAVHLDVAWSKKPGEAECSRGEGDAAVWSRS